MRALPTPSPGRVTFLADHIDSGLDAASPSCEKDLLLYPLLLSGYPRGCDHPGGRAPSIRSSSHLSTVPLPRTHWRQHPTVETGEALAASLDHLNEVLQPHLDDEEQQVVPLAAVTLTQEEWDAVGEHSSSHIPSAKRAVTFGMILEPLDEDDRNFMKRNLPTPVRMLYPFMIQRPWKKYASTLRTGT